MLIRDHDIRLRIPSTNASFVTGEPIEGPFFSPDTFKSSSPGIGYTTAETAFIGIISTLGRAISYLQRGGVKGDTHFPWHSNSKLASLRGELSVWCSSAPQMFQDPSFFTGPDGPMTLLTITCYHLIHCLVFRDFLPVDAQQEIASAATTAVHRTWQAETTEACLSSANEIVNTMQAAYDAQVTNVPPFIGYVSVFSAYASFCLFIAATIHLHGWHWNIQQISTQSKEFLTFELRKLLEMKKLWAGLDNIVRGTGRLC
jgi:hypothetical protein